MRRPNDDAGKGGRGSDEPADAGSYEDQEPERALTFMQHDFGLDRRLMKAVAKIGFVYPTLVQSKCIPLALKGKDLLVSFSFNFVAMDSCIWTPGSFHWLEPPQHHCLHGSPVYAPRIFLSIFAKSIGFVLPPPSRRACASRWR